MMSPLQLDSHHLLEAALRANLSWSTEDEDAPFSALLQVRGTTLQVVGEEVPPYVRLNVETRLFEDGQADGVLSARVFLTLDINETDADLDLTPYSLHLLLYGEVSAAGFSREGDEARPGALQVVRANSASMLYGIARQVVTDLTLQTPYRSLVLPSLRFEEVVRREAEIEAAAAETPDEQ